MAVRHTLARQAQYHADSRSRSPSRPEREALPGLFTYLPTYLPSCQNTNCPLPSIHCRASLYDLVTISRLTVEQDSDTSMQSHDDDRHRHKRPKLNVFAERRGGLELPRQRPSQAGHGSGHGPGPGPGHGHGRGRGLGLMRHISNAYQRVVTPTPKAADSLDGTTVRATPSRLGTPKTPPDLPRMKFVFVGDPKCGKSSLLL